MSFIERLKAWISSQLACTDRLRSCIDDKMMLEEEGKAMEIANKRQENIIGDMEKELSSLREPDPLAEARDHWNHKYPARDITYGGRYFPFDKRRKLEIDVRLFITINDFVIVRDIEANNLLVSDPTNCNADIMKIYKHTRTKPLNPYRYEFDEPNLGVAEFWMFPHELRIAKKGDCDDWGNELAAYLITAGVPAFRVRCVAGATYGGGGHLTVYVLDDTLSTWYHINSTTSISQIKTNDLTMMPQLGDETDKIGISDVWFSFNNLYSWHTFKTDSAAETFNKERTGFLKHITIH